MFLLIDVERKRHDFGYLLSLLYVLLIDDSIGRKLTLAVVLLAPLLALIICMSSQDVFLLS